MISGWAHPAESLAPLAEKLSARFAVEVRSATEQMEQENLPEVDFIVGHSLGGLLVLEHLPASCKKLVLLSSSARFCATSDYPCGVQERVLKRMIQQFKRQPEAVLSAFFAQVHHPASPQNLSPCSASPEQLLSGLEYLLQADLRERISSINLPVLLLHGTQDAIIPISASEWLLDHLPQAQLQRIENGGHALFAHQTDLLAQEISLFLDRRSDGLVACPCKKRDEAVASTKAQGEELTP